MPPRPPHLLHAIAGPLVLPLALLLPAAARADLPDEDRLLVGDVLAVGVAGDGSLCNGALALGLLLDPDGPGGPAPLGGDALLPGRDFELWSLTTSDGRRWVQGEADVGSDLTLDFEAPTAGEAIDALRGAGGDGEVSVRWDMVVRAREGLLLLTLEVEAIDALPGLRLARVFDPDLDAWSSGAYSTVNSALDDVAVASSAVDDRAVALAAAGGQAGICSWCTTAAGVEDGRSASEADDQLGVFVDLGDLLAGERRTVHLAYAVGADPLDVAATAQEAVYAADLDGDGAPDSEDCAPLDPAAAPGAVELLDGLDNDCDGAIDEGDGASPGSPRDDWAEAGADSPGGPGAASGDSAADAPGKGASGCATLPATPGLGLPLAALIALAAARRRSRR